MRSDHSQDRYAAQLADVAASRSPELVAAALFLLGALLLVPSAIGIASLARGRGGALVAAGSILLGIASIWLAAGRAMFCILLYALSGGSVSSATAVRALDVIGNSGAFGLILVTLAAMLLAPVVLGLGLWRAGRAPWWLPALWAGSTIGFLRVETSKLGDLAAFGTMMAVLGALGLAAAREPDVAPAPAPA